MRASGRRPASPAAAKPPCPTLALGGHTTPGKHAGRRLDRVPARVRSGVPPRRRCRREGRRRLTVGPQLAADPDIGVTLQDAARTRERREKEVSGGQPQVSGTCGAQIGHQRIPACLSSAYRPAHRHTLDAVRRSEGCSHPRRPHRAPADRRRRRQQGRGPAGGTVALITPVAWPRAVLVASLVAVPFLIHLVRQLPP